MKVAYALCGLAILLQATQADARGALRNSHAQEPPEDSFASDESAMTTSESEPFISAEPSGDEKGILNSYKTDAVDEPTTASYTDYVDGGYIPDSDSYGGLADGDGGEGYTPTEEPPAIEEGGLTDGYQTGLSNDGLPLEGYSGEIYPDPEEPPEVFVAPEIEEPSWDDLHPPGWNGPGFSDDWGSNTKWQDIDTAEPQYYVDEPIPDAQPAYDPHQYETGWSDDSLPPWARNSYTGDGTNDGYSGENYDQSPEILVAPEIDEPTQYEPSWDNLHPPGWNGPGFSDRYDGYTTEDRGYDRYTGGNDDIQYPQVLDIPAIENDEPTETTVVDTPYTDDGNNQNEAPASPGSNDDSFRPWASDDYEVPDSPPDWDSHRYETGWSDDSLPPWARDGYTGDGEIVVPHEEDLEYPRGNYEDISGDSLGSPDTPSPEEIGGPELLDWSHGNLPTPDAYLDPPQTIDVPPVSVDNDHSNWRDLHPPGWNDDSLPPWARDGYSGDDNFDPNSPRDYSIIGAPNYLEPPTPLGIDTWSLPSQEEYHGQTIGVDTPEYPKRYITGGHGVALPPFALHARPDFEFKPSSKSVPPFEVLDANGDNDVTPDEWTSSVEKLKAAAAAKTSRIRDAHAKQLLDDIIDFHYANLHACIAQGVQAHVSPSDMSKVTKGIASSCYVKFRYSLFAGAAPFEWIARKQPAITGEQIISWFQKQFDIAQTDVASGRIRPESLPAVPYLMMSLSCLVNIIEAHDGTMFDSIKYYKLMDTTLDCVGITS